MENLQPSEITNEQNDCWDMTEDDLKQRPPALEPIYVTDTINQPILLYDGALAIEQGGRIVEGTGKVEFTWFPYCGVKYEFQSNTSAFAHAHINPFSRAAQDAQLRLTKHETSVKISLLSIRSGERTTAVSGNLSEAISIGSDQKLEYLLCHIVNFHDVIGSNVMEAENWKLTLYQLPTTTEHIEQLICQSGFAITHAAKLERSDGKTFTGTEAIKFLDLCYWFFSFARGFRVPIILLVGYNSENECVWQYWVSRAGFSWKGVDSWFPKHESGALAQLLPGFLRWWKSWDKGIANRALHWYLESNINAGRLEGSIVLTQVALELIAWTLFVEQEKVFSKTAFDKLKASGQLRHLLSKFSISEKLPPDWEVEPINTSDAIPELYADCSPQPLLPNLVAIANQQDNKWVDGPHAFTVSRNRIVHPKKNKKDSNASSNATLDASNLGRWYLELVLLALCDYQGKYINRLLIPHQNAEVVPWIQNCD
jgi:hypothetical protein